jgi:hypothetical protein
VEAVGLALWQILANAAAPAVADLIHLRRPRGLGRIPAFCHGFADGLGTHVNRTNLRYEAVRDRRTAAES